jgi:hypothetical protein
MKKILERMVNVSIFLLLISIGPANSMPGSDAESSDESTPTPQPSTTGAAKTAAPADGTKAAAPSDAPPSKPKPLSWPETSDVSEDNKKLLLSNSKEIVQLFTLAQEVCKNMDDTLSGLNTLRDNANKKYRDTIKELDPLLQRIGAAQAENKKENKKS